MCQYQYEQQKDKVCMLFHSESHTNPHLPLDKRNRCFFHSTDAIFASGFDTAELFEKTIRWLDDVSNAHTYDFTAARIGAGISKLEFDGLVLKKNLDLQYSTIFCRIEFRNVNSNFFVRFNNADARDSILLENCNFSEVDFSYLQGKSFLIFENCTITAESLMLVRSKLNFPLIIRDCKIDSIISCFEAEFNGLILERSAFYGVLNFESVVVKKQLIVDNCGFYDNVEFVNTNFVITDQGVKDAFSPIDFNDISVGEKAILHFKGSEPQSLLAVETRISFHKEEPKGKLHFTNVNFNYLQSQSKDTLLALEHSGKVVIGSGCLRYRHEMIRTVAMSHENQSLATELSRVFARFFEDFNGLNLGVEIRSRSAMGIILLYFSDEDISKEEFNKRLAITEVAMWQLVGTSKKDNQGLSKNLVSTMDTLVNLTSIFFKICIRIPFGKINEEELKGLTDSVNFGQQPVIETREFKQVIVNHYNQSVLFGINNRQIISAKKENEGGDSNL